MKGLEMNAGNMRNVVSATVKLLMEVEPRDGEQREEILKCIQELQSLSPMMAGIRRRSYHNER